MGCLYQPLLFLLARCCRNEFIRQVDWLRGENEMLRKRVGKLQTRFAAAASGSIRLALGGPVR